jgi:hypothetical protein
LRKARGKQDALTSRFLLLVIPTILLFAENKSFSILQVKKFTKAIDK